MLILPPSRPIFASELSMSRVCGQCADEEPAGVVIGYHTRVVRIHLALVQFQALYEVIGNDEGPTGQTDILLHDYRPASADAHAPRKSASHVVGALALLDRKS